MKKALFFFFALTIIACGNKKAESLSGTASAKVAGNTVAETNDDYVPQRSDYSFRTEVRTIKEDDEVRWDTIVVYLTDAKGRTQQLYSQSLPLDTASWSKGSIGDIEEEDWNFDGIPDLQVCTGPMNGFGNFTYDVWLWDDKAHQFKKLDDDCEIYSPEIDTANKCIVSIWRLDDDVELVKYQWKDGKLVETSREEMTYKELVDD